MDTGSGPVLVARFEKECESLRKIAPHLLFPFLSLFRPLSFVLPTLPSTLVRTVANSSQSFPTQHWQATTTPQKPETSRGSNILLISG